MPHPFDAAYFGTIELMCYIWYNSKSALFKACSHPTLSKGWLLSVLTTRSVVFIGHVDQRNLLVVANGVSSDLLAYFGPEGSLRPQEVASDSGSWTTSQGVLKKQRGTYAWVARGARGITPVYARNADHFIIGGKPDKEIHVVSRMRRFVYAGTNGVAHVAVTAVGDDMRSVEFYMNFPGRSDEMIRRPVGDVLVSANDRRAFHVDLPPKALFSYMEVSAYRRNLSKRASLPSDLPRCGYVGLMDGYLRPIDVSTLRINQTEGRIRTM